MTTFAGLIEDVEGFLNSFGAVRDKVTSLTADITSSATSLTVVDGKQIDRGFIEIDSELLNVASVDSTTGTVTLHPWGRGQRGTTAAAHTANTMVVDSPRFPRFRVKQEVQKTIDQLYPDLFGVASYETTVTASKVAYQVPAAVESVISVMYQSTGPSGVWVPVTRYRLDFNADTTAFTTGKSLDIYMPMQPGRTLKVVYRTDLGTFASETDTLASVFVDEAWRDLIVAGAVGRCLMGLDPARLELDSIESQARGQLVQPMQASATAKQFMGLYQMRLSEERRTLLMRYPSTQVRVS